MLVRIVKMSFDPHHIENFLSIFDANKSKIRNFDGCEYLELYQDKSRNYIFFTYSYWISEQHLENYRHSKLFKTIWSETKILFNAKPEAWSVNKLITLD
ncbi:antibiotic biosynthesis monooxygenase [Flavobacteriaceae bacterium MHTCC 0001]